MNREVQKACEILEELSRHDLDEFEIETAGLKLRLARESGSAAALAAHLGQISEAAGRSAALEAARLDLGAAPAPAAADRGAGGQAATPAVAAAQEPAADPEAGLVPITAPMVGMFYRSSAPDKPPFVQVGDMIEAGQPVCIIEAMKLMNLITSQARGRVAKIKVENQTPVQTGQVLVLLEPA